MVALLVGLAMQIILEAQKPEISLERKVEALTFAQTVIKYANEHPEIDTLNQVVTITPMVKPIDERVKMLEDKQSETDAKAQDEADKKLAKELRVKPLRDAWNATRAKIAENQSASEANQHKKVILGTGITSGEIALINIEDKRLSDEYTNVLLPLYQSQGKELGDAER